MLGTTGAMAAMVAGLVSAQVGAEAKVGMVTVTVTESAGEMVVR